MAMAVILVVIISGIVAGIYWYKIVDAPREKYIKTSADNNVIIDGRYGMLHHESNADSFDGDFGG